LPSVVGIDLLRRSSQRARFAPSVQIHSPSRRGAYPENQRSCCTNSTAPAGSRSLADLRCAAARARRWAGRMTTTTQGVSPCRSGRTEAISSPTPDCRTPKNVRKLQGRARRSNWNDCAFVADARASVATRRRLRSRAQEIVGAAATTAPPGDAAARGRASRPSPARPTRSSGPTPPRRPLCMAQGEPFSWRAANQNSPCFRPGALRTLSMLLSRRAAQLSVSAPNGEVWSWAPTMSRTVPLRRRTKS